MNYKKNLKYIKNILEQAVQIKNELPIAAAIVNPEGRIISQATNKKKLFPFDHAECIAIQKAIEQEKKIHNSTLYTTLEPCLMCVGIAIHANISVIYYGARSPESGIQTKHNLDCIAKIMIIPLLTYEKEIEKIVKNFFIKNKRSYT